MPATVWSEKPSTAATIDLSLQQPDRTISRGFRFAGPTRIKGPPHCFKQRHVHDRLVAAWSLDFAVPELAGVDGVSQCSDHLPSTPKPVRLGATTQFVRGFGNLSGPLSAGGLFEHPSNDFSLPGIRHELFRSRIGIVTERNSASDAPSLPLLKSLYLSNNRGGSSYPFKRVGVLVVLLDVAFDGLLQFADAAKRATAYSLAGDLGKPALDLIQPRGTFDWRRARS